MLSGAHTGRPLGLLMSGGLDSAILLAELVQQGQPVQPLYIQMGCAWQAVERTSVQRFITALDDPAIQPVVDLQLPLADLYGDHWSMTGCGVPNQETPDEAVLLWGRNPLLLVKAMLWCTLNDVEQLAIATLSGNPFTDATASFFNQFEAMIATATGQQVAVLRPFAKLTKQDVLALGTGLPLQNTFSCLAPVGDHHCGVCNKCGERRRALQMMPEGDPTIYASPGSAVNTIQ